MKTPTGKNRPIQIENTVAWIRYAVHQALIALFCGILGYLRWGKMDTLVLGDAPRWLFVAQRASAGQVPYRDFSWLYPPFSVLSLGWTMRWFGVTFIVAQVFVDIVSIIVILAAYFIARLVLPRFLLLPVMFCPVAVCGTSLMFFNLFSLLTYVPALQTAVGGFFLFLLAVLNHVQTGKMKQTTWVMVTVGGFVASYSKPETLLNSVIYGFGSEVPDFNARCSALERSRVGHCV